MRLPNHRKLCAERLVSLLHLRLARRPAPFAPAPVGFAGQSSSPSEVLPGAAHEARCVPRRAGRGRSQYVATYGLRPSPSLVRSSLRTAFRPALKLASMTGQHREGIGRKVFGLWKLTLESTLLCGLESCLNRLDGIGVALPCTVERLGNRDRISFAAQHVPNDRLCEIRV